MTVLLYGHRRLGWTGSMFWHAYLESESERESFRSEVLCSVKDFRFRRDPEVLAGVTKFHFLSSMTR